jgi:hypothetical protein
MEDIYRQRLRVLLILYFFSEPVDDVSDPHLASVFHSEVKIQKIDFLIRYPSYFCFELLRLHEESGVPDEITTKFIIKQVFSNGEPELRTDHMRRFFYGAYEELDAVISFLTSVNLVVFKSQRSTGLLSIKKEYYLTKFGQERIEKGLIEVPAAKWYFDRCSLIQQYFGDLSGTQLKDHQYDIEEYKETPLNCITLK